MSADNYYIIRKCYDHGKPAFAAVMGFASIVETPEIGPTDPWFPTVGEAFRWADKQDSEYGTTVHPECGEDW